MKETTKKLQKLVEQRKRRNAVFEQGSIKQYSRPSRTTSSESDYYSGSLEDD